MTSTFEIKYIEIQWYDKDTVTKVIESLHVIPVEYNDEHSHFECETTIYPRTEGILRGQLAVRFIAGPAVIPCIKMSDGAEQQLFPVEDIDSGKTWWIVQDSWDAKEKYWRHSSVNTAGTLILVLDDVHCHINIGSMDFSREQLERYLTGFKDDLWELILDESSSVQASREQGSIGINNATIDCAQNIIMHAHKILSNPKAELREIQTLKPRKAVKPVNRTFMELATKTNQSVLTSRAVTPTFNMAENRYILFALERSYRIIKQIVILSGNKAKRYAALTDKLQQQYDSFTDSVTIDRDLVVKDLEIIRQRCKLSYWQQQLAQRIFAEKIVYDADGPQYNVLHFRSQKPTQENDGFFIEINVQGQWKKDNEKSTVLSFNSKVNASLLNLVRCLRQHAEYKITGTGRRYETAKAVVYVIDYLNDIEIVDARELYLAQQKYSQEIKQGKVLDANNWQRKLNPRELDEQTKEKVALQNRIEFYSENQSLSEAVFKKVEPKQRQLAQLITQFKALGVTASSHFPNSMTFVQNPHYQGVHNGYKQLMASTRLTNEDLLLSLEEIDAIGLVNMPLLYERWCLLQIMKVLIESFRFIPQANWKYQVVDAIKGRKKDIEILFDNPHSKRTLTLTYEKTLENGKRPDFVIDLQWTADKDDQARYSRRFVLDAKFYDHSTFARSGGLLGVIDGLRNQKDYREATNNPVFLIHPCKDAIADVVTAQHWGKYSYLGEAGSGAGGIKPNHDYGAIFLSPIDKELYNDELQRLLGLFLQYKLESPNTSSLPNDLTQAKPFCIRCGSVELRTIEKTGGYTNKQGVQSARTPRSVWLQCTECEQFISFNHCQYSDTRLVKNGLYWTYHSARAIEPFNIKCPECGEWGGW